MATSGSFSTSSYSDSEVTRYLTFRWSRSSYSVENNTSTIEWSVVGDGYPSNYWVRTHPIQVIVDGEQVYYSDTSVDLYGGTVVASGTATFTHNNNGDRSFSAIVKAGIYYHSLDYCTGSGTFQLDNIPRYASITRTVKSRTETSLTVEWVSEQAVDKVEYSFDDGKTWTVELEGGPITSGIHEINGLEAGKTYRHRMRTHRVDSGLTGVTGYFEIQTYPYPYATVTPNFEVGKSVTIEVFNPLNHNFNIAMIGDDGTVKASTATYHGTSVTGFSSDEWKEFWLNSCKKSKSGTYKVRIGYQYYYTTTAGGTYTIKASDVKPAIKSFSAEDTSAYKEITGDSSIIVQNRSTVRYKVTPSLKGGATVASCTVEVNGKTHTLKASGDSYIGGNEAINSARNLKAVVNLTDSRGYSVKKEYEVKVEAWEPPTAIIELARDSGYYTATKLKVDANYSSVSGKNSVTIQYRAKRHGTASYTVTGYANDKEETSFNCDNQYVWDVQIIVRDSFSGSVTYNLTLNKGIPIIFFDALHNSVGVGVFPTGDGTLEVAGLDGDVATNINDLKTLEGPTLYTPAIRWSTGSTMEVDNIICRYERQGRILIVGGRFHIKTVGTASGADLLISLPDDMKLNDTGAQMLGTFMFPDGVARGYLRVSGDDATKLLVTGNPAGGLKMSDILVDTGYYGFTATATLALE